MWKVPFRGTLNVPEPEQHIDKAPNPSSPHLLPQAPVQVTLPHREVLPGPETCKSGTKPRLLKVRFDVSLLPTNCTGKLGNSPPNIVLQPGVPQSLPRALGDPRCCRAVTCRAIPNAQLRYRYGSRTVQWRRACSCRFKAPAAFRHFSSTTSNQLVRKRLL